MSQTINRDPEVKELKRELGLPGFSMWIEVLAETDGTDGIWKGSEIDIGRLLAGVCDSNSRGSRRFLDWVTDRGWITWLNRSAPGNRRDLKVVNHAKYHPARDAKQTPGADTKGDSIVSPPFLSSPNHTNPNPPIVPQGDEKASRLQTLVDRIWNAWPKHKRKNKGDVEKSLKRINPSPELLARMLAKIEQLKKSIGWTKDNGQYVPYPASWLNAKGWEDEADDFLGSNQRRFPD